MDAQFWLQRWQEGQIGFHRSDVMPLLEQYWPSLGVPAGGRVFVPLAGKTWTCTGWPHRACRCWAVNCRRWQWRRSLPKPG